MSRETSPRKFQPHSGQHLWNTMAALCSKLEVEKKLWIYFPIDLLLMLFSPISDWAGGSPVGMLPKQRDTRILVCG